MNEATEIAAEKFALIALVCAARLDPKVSVADFTSMVYELAGARLPESEAPRPTVTESTVVPVDNIGPYIPPTPHSGGPKAQQTETTTATNESRDESRRHTNHNVYRGKVTDDEKARLYLKYKAVTEDAGKKTAPRGWIEDKARYYRVSPATIYNWIQQGSGKRPT